MISQRKLALASLVAFTAGLAYAADQTILGSQLLVKNPSTADKRKIVGKGKEAGSPNTIVGNPVASGGYLQVTANGGSPSSQTFLLPTGNSMLTGKPFWSGDALKGFKYKDSKGENGPVKVAQIKKSASGTFSIKTVVVGKNGTITVVPPNPGTSGCVLLGINGGDTYSVALGPTSQVTNKGATLFKAKKPTVEGSCLPPTTTTTTTTTSTTTTSSSTTTTTLYGSPSRAFIDRVLGLLD
jgi:hypothetical protein